MDPEAIEKELRYRIESDIAHHGGKLPERSAIAWRAYLSGLLEWLIIGRPIFERLGTLLPGERAIGPAQRSGARSEATVHELRARIEADLARHGGNLPEHEAIAWHAYLAALYEWSVLSTGFRSLVDLLPRVENDPASDILAGRPFPGGGSE